MTIHMLLARNIDIPNCSSYVFQFPVKIPIQGAKRSGRKHSSANSTQTAA